jgi:capsular polysaccharide biosynthesis protein
MEQQNEEMEIDLMELFYVLRGRIVIILLTAGLFAIVTGLSTYYFIKPMYSSTSSIYVLTSSSAGGIGLSISDLQIGTSLTSDYIEMIQSPTVLDKVISNLGMGNELNYKTLKSLISINNPSDTRILNLTVKYGDPRVAKALVDELAEVSRDRISEIMDTDKPNIFEDGKIEVAPISPNVKRYTMIGGIIGLLLASAIIIITHLMDDTIHSAEDIEKYLNPNTLAAIPVSEGSEAEIRRDDRKRRKGDSIFTIIKRHFKKSKHHSSDKK